VPDDDQLWPQQSSDPHGIPDSFSPAPGRAATRPARHGGNESPFPEPGARTAASTGGGTATITRRAVAAGGLAGVAFLAACNTPGLRELAGGRFARKPLTGTPVAGAAPTATATPTPSPSLPPKPLPTVTGTMKPARPPPHGV
jgi:hypothetical protein